MRASSRVGAGRAAGLCLLLLGGSLAGCATGGNPADQERAWRQGAAASGAAASGAAANGTAAASAAAVGAAVKEGDALVGERAVSRLAAGLTITEAVDIALLNNKALEAEFYEIGISRAELVQSGLLANPSLGAALRFPAGGGDPTIEARLALDLIDLWHRPARKRVGEHRLERRILQAAHAAAQVASRTKEAYVAAVAAGSQRRIEQLNLQATGEFLDLTLARQAAGAATEAEVNTARAEHLEQNALVRSAELHEVDTKLRLLGYLGLDVALDELTVVDALTIPSGLDLDLEMLQGIAEKHRLDLWAAQENVRAMEAAVSLEKRLVLPTVQGSVEIEGQGGEYAVGPGLDLELPLFDRNQAQVSIAGMRRRQAAASFEALRLAAHRQVSAAFERVVATLQTARSYEMEILPLRESSLDHARKAFGAGKTGFLNVLEAQKQLISARREAAAWAESSALMLISLEAACGRPLRDLTRGAAPGGELPEDREGR